MRLRRPSPSFVLAFVALAVALGGVAVATVPATDGDIHFCYSTKTGSVEVVDTQTDTFSCDRNWRGFIVDTEETSLVSPNGAFRVQATNTGITLSGAGASVKLNSSGLSVNGTNINLQATGQSTLKSSAVTRVQGAVVQLNGGCSPVARRGDVAAAPGGQGGGPAPIVTGSTTVLSC